MIFSFSLGGGTHTTTFSIRLDHTKSASEATTTWVGNRGCLGCCLEFLHGFSFSSHSAGGTRNGLLSLSDFLVSFTVGGKYPERIMPMEALPSR